MIKYLRYLWASLLRTLKNEFTDRDENSLTHETNIMMNYEHSKTNPVYDTSKIKKENSFSNEAYN